MRILAGFFSLLSLASFSTATTLLQNSPPELLVDKGACPFECCIYREWTARTSIDAYASPSTGSHVVSKIAAGTKVLALTGEVHTKAGRFLVKRRHNQYKPGDVLFVYTYAGEGFFKVWFDGKTYQEELEFSPYGGSTGKRCTDPRICWGELVDELRSVWWVKLRLPSGRIVWTLGADSFDGQDGCG